MCAVCVHVSDRGSESLLCHSSVLLLARSVPFPGSPQVGIRSLVVALCLGQAERGASVSGIYNLSLQVLFDMGLKMNANYPLPPDIKIICNIADLLADRNPWWIMERFISMTRG